MDIEGVAPAANLTALVTKLGYRGKIAMESQTVGLTFANGQSVVSAFDQPLHNGDEIITELRQDKSLAELDMHHRAAALSDDALDAALKGTRAGAFEGDILADMQGAVFRGGGDYAGNEFIIGSDQRGLLCRFGRGAAAFGPARSANPRMVWRLRPLSRRYDANLDYWQSLQEAPIYACGGPRGPGGM